MCAFFYRLFSLYKFTQFRVTFPVQYSRFLIDIVRSVFCRELCLYLNLNLQIYPSPLVYHQVTISLISTSLTLFLFWISVHLYRFLDSMYRRYHMMFVYQFPLFVQSPSHVWPFVTPWAAELGKKMATHSIILAWRIPWTEEPDEIAKSRTRL